MPDTAKGPFPFKGKGGNDWSIPSLRGRIEHLQKKRELTLRQMKSLIDDYENTFDNKLPAYLVLHKTANGQYLRWRMSGVKQRYFSIAEDEIGKSFLLSQSRPVRGVLMDIEKNRLQLNLLHGEVFYQIKSLRKLISHLLDLREFTKTSPVNLCESNI